MLDFTIKQTYTLGVDSALEGRLQKIEARLKQLEPLEGDSIPQKESTFWALETLQKSGNAAGELLYAGTVVLPGARSYIWQMGAESQKILAQPWNHAAPVLAALGHPVRLELLRSVLLGRSSSAELAELPTVGTTGQLYHHVKELQSAGWLRQEARGRYTVPPERTIPLLVILTASDALELSAELTAEPTSANP